MVANAAVAGSSAFGTQAVVLATGVAVLANLLLMAALLDTAPETPAAIVLALSLFSTTFAGLALGIATTDALLPVIAIETPVLWLGAALLAWRLSLFNAYPNLRAAFWLLAALGLLSLALAPLGASATATAAYLRLFWSPLALALVAAGAVSRPESAQALRRVLYAIGWLCVVGTLLELGVGPGTWHSIFHFDALARIKGPISEVTDDFFGNYVTRRSGFIIEPVNASYAYSALTLLALFDKRRIAGCIFGLMALLTFAKGGLLIAIIPAVSLLVLRKVTVRRILLLVLAGIPALYLYAVLTGGTSVLNPYAHVGGGPSSLVHGSGLVFGLQSIPAHPLGHGTGAGGNISNILTSGSDDRSAWLSSGSESTIATLAYQLGLPGLLLFLFGMASLAAGLATPPRSEPVTRRQLAGGLVIAAVVVASVFQENTLGPQAAAIPFAVAFLLAKHVPPQTGHGRGVTMAEPLVLVGAGR